jgi:hypothetical protein
MPRCQTGATRRALITALALYGLLVQAFLAGLVPFGAAAAAADPGVLCQHEAAGDPAPAQSSQHQHDCCLAACMAAAIQAPALPRSEPVLWPARVAARLTWRFDPAQARAPPASPLVSARGPPSV